MNMLLQFKTENFKSFLDEMNFSMTPALNEKIWNIVF